ncbi:MAG: metallophosphoesterase [Lachnospiraceae bacterium]|nr:metallophosphoesterase [Lachnospiraceae bacterium]
MNYYISDLHLFHNNVTKAGKNYDDRPFDNLEQMHLMIKDKWNAKVTNGDTVYILGDVAMRGTREELMGFVAQLKGHKILIKGNHDDVKDLRYRQLYEDICDYKEITDNISGRNESLVLCHYPILLWNNQHRGSILLYGHVHNSIEEYYFRKCLNEMNNEDFFGRRTGDRVLRAYNVGCMMPYMDYEPRSLAEIVESGSQSFHNFC